MSDEQSYKVGYCMPPVEHQFKTGQPGPRGRGRPRGSKNISTIIAAALAQRVTINQNGQRRTISKIEAAVTQIANKAAAGDRHATKLIVDMLHQSEIRDEARADTMPLGAQERRAQDLAILASIRNSARNVLPEDDDDQAI
jgi:hypothetical protein